MPNAAGTTGGRRQAAVAVAGSDEEHRESDGREQAPHDAGRVGPGLAGDVENQTQAEERHEDAGPGEPSGGPAGLQPHPQDDEHGPAVLQEQGHADREVLDGVEVGNLAARDGHEAVEEDEAALASDQAPPPSAGDDGRTEQEPSGDADPQEDDRSRGPSLSRSALANEPEVPKAAAESTAARTPLSASRRRGTREPARPAGPSTSVAGGVSTGAATSASSGFLSRVSRLGS